MSHWTFLHTCVIIMRAKLAKNEQCSWNLRYQGIRGSQITTHFIGMWKSSFWFTHSFYLQNSKLFPSSLLKLLVFFLNHCFLFKQYFMDGKKCAELAFQLSANKSQIKRWNFLCTLSDTHISPAARRPWNAFHWKSLCCLLPGGRKGGPREPTG